MTNVMLVWLAAIVWGIRKWEDIDLTYPGMSFRRWVWDRQFGTPKLDRRIDEWLGD